MYTMSLAFCNARNYRSIKHVYTHTNGTLTGIPQSTKRAPSGQSWNNLSNNISSVGLYTKIQNKCPWVHTNINKWLSK